MRIEAETPDRPASLRVRALRGAALSVAGAGTGQALRLVSNLIVSRLLFPEAFGLMAIVSMVRVGLQMISDFGVRNSIIQHRSGEDRDFLDTAWTIQVFRGFVLWGSATLIALPMARFYDQHALLSLIPAAATAAIVDGFTSTKIATRTRRIQLARIVAIDLSGKVGSLLVMLVLAYVYRSVWALVAGGLVQSTIQMLLSHMALPGKRDRFRWHPAYGREILHFGKWILLSSLFTFFGRRMDVIVLGRLVNIDVLGIYSIGILGSTAARVLFSRFAQVLMASFSEANREGSERLRTNLRTTKRLVLPAGALMCAAGVAIGPAFYRYLYDPRYWEAGWIAQLSMGVLWFSMLQDVNGRALVALGDSRGLALSNGVRTAVSTVGCVLGVTWFGLAGALFGLIAGAAAAWAASLAVLSGHKVGSVIEDLAVTLAGIPVALLCALPVQHWVEPRQVAVATLAAGAVLLLPAVAGFGIYAWRTTVR